jgi:L-ribulokinase
MARSTSRSARAALGLDFGTESVRALLVALDGRELASAVVAYRHGQIVRELPGTGEPLPPDFALQHPRDWLDSSAKAVRRAVRAAGIQADDVMSIGVDFTSCTMLPALADGTPLCLVPRQAADKFSWPKLWKHHGAKAQTERINRVARERNEPWLARYGGSIGLEWFFPKLLETLEGSPAAANGAEVWLEGGDWLVWRLVGGPAGELPRSTCQAGYKAMWNAREGYPSAAFLEAVDPRLPAVVADKMPGRLLPPGERAGELAPPMAKALGLRPGTPVSAAAIDAHAGVPGAGAAEPDTLVMVLGTSSCHMLNSAVERLVPGVAGVVEGGILPGMFGYETGQAAVGDAFDWLRRLAGERDFSRLDRLAAALAPGAGGVASLDWLNGCRTPLMDGSLAAAFSGLTLAHGPEHLYRALMEATACGLRWIVELLVEGGVPVKRFLATGGLPFHNPLLVQIYADVLARPIAIAPSRHGPALGAAILGVLAAGKAASGFASAGAAIRAMAGRPAGAAPVVVRPSASRSRAYDPLYARYRRLADQAARGA